ncbi:hypothetical protein TREMEDRAFT_35553 [Tremella mesenterica DSM 1558]|uniref:uncharacterized protein n=1 Tax=Tremella mesenterica (strain ATCC 24925 / CBS 8224 / DSM 1558 / NBRC 9311 / NRRL Y-6157 / RJB 2259-6 / UBC 559-6) TaxID=578456 RepID=UPI00032BB4BD|nr:uncharacterized protein TREMEDRAFT_35553 [Tremella mesenterica DSM 1558]EIW66106.1 hypothetical protein TREMEDRAFT_35553 [Tremella mesenterica DSM 1558]
MAEHILGVLFVTVSSRGTNVWRYPPDPSSPLERLRQPIYPTETYTATDAITAPKRRLALPGLSSRTGATRSSKGSASITHSASKSHPQPSTSRKKGSRYYVDPRGHTAGSSNGSVTRQGREYTSASEEGSSSDGSTSSSTDREMNLPWSTQRRSNAGSSLNNGHEITGRRESVEKTNGRDRRESVEKEKEKVREKEKDKDHIEVYVEEQWSSAMGYSLEFLGDLLAPPRSACHRKFEICIDEVVLIGHPVCPGKDGRWAYPEEEEEPERGRRGRGGGTGLGTSGTLENRQKTYAKDQNKQGTYGDDKDGKKAGDGEGKDDTEETIPQLHMFNLVLILDKPDPKSGQYYEDGVASSIIFEEVYREVIRKWTGAAFALQVRENWVAKETYEMSKMRDRLVMENQSIHEAIRIFQENFSLNRALNSLFYELHQLRHKPTTPLYSYFPNIIRVHVADIPLSMIISPRLDDQEETDQSYSYPRSDLKNSDVDSEEFEDDDEEEEDTWEDAWGETHVKRRRKVRVEPWQTLLLLDDDVKRSDKILGELIGGIQERDVGGRESLGTEWSWMSDLGEAQLMKAFIDACDVTKPLADIAHILRCDLDAIVVPLARELVQNKKAVLIDVVNIHLRSIVIPTSIQEHLLSISDYTTQFSRLFPTLPSLPYLLSLLSSSPGPFRDIIPMTRPARPEYLRALVWLLAHDLVVQLHTRARIVATPEVKLEAWKRLWYRRRARWVERIRLTQLRESRRVSETPHPVDKTTAQAADESNLMIEPSQPSLETSHMTSPMTRLSQLQQPPPDLPDTFDPELEIDSDAAEDTGVGIGMEMKMIFNIDQNDPDPKDFPNFQPTFIFRPARAQKEEARWLRVIREKADELLASKFDL